MTVGPPVLVHHAPTSLLVRGQLSAHHEEDCFTAGGRLRGIWFTTEPLDDPVVASLEVPADDLAPYEVTAAGAAHRAFVLPAVLAMRYPLIVNDHA